MPLPASSRVPWLVRSSTPQSRQRDRYTLRPIDSSCGYDLRSHTWPLFFLASKIGWRRVGSRRGHVRGLGPCGIDGVAIQE